jgi:hypothetical protein
MATVTPAEQRRPSYDRVMKTGGGAVPAPLRAALASVMCAAFAATALSAPSLFAGGASAPAVVGLAALAFVLAAAVTARSRPVVLVVSADESLRAAGDEAPPVVAGRATDPLHYPLRPRAPGRA